MPILTSIAGGMTFFGNETWKLSMGGKLHYHRCVVSDEAGKPLGKECGVEMADQ